MSNKMTFGEWTGAVIAGNSGAKVVRVDAGFFNVDGLKRIAESIDKAVLVAQMEGRKLEPLESFAMEVLFALAGWEDLAKAKESYQRHLNSKQED